MMLGLVKALARRTWKAARLSDAPDREGIARTYLQGQGLEIGALHNPLRVPARVRVTYVDRLEEPVLRRHYPELAGQPFAPVDVVDDGERLGKFADVSQDFVIANHFLEHCQDPIGSLFTLMRVLRVGGILYLVVPDKRYTFDRDRPVTPLAHLWQDHRDGPGGSKAEHFREWTALVEKIQDVEAADRRIRALMTLDYSIHYHVWTQGEFLEFLLEMRRILPFEIELVARRTIELICVLRKTDGIGATIAEHS
jgi:SAM-dependent methyltransferase